MKAVVLKSPMKLQVEDVDKPMLDSDQVMVKVESCGICGSDIRYFKGENPWALHTLGAEVKNPPNIILGHEFAGVVTEAGNKSHEYLIGKRVAVLPYKECGVCNHCRSGAHNLCKHMVHLGHAAGWDKMEYYPGGMAEYCPVWARMCYPLPDAIDFEEGALLDLVGVGLHAINVVGMRPNIEAAVIGCGPIGNAISQILTSWGARRVFCMDRYETSLEILSKIAMEEVIDVNNIDPAEYVNGKTNHKGLDLVFDTVGSLETQTHGLHMLGSQGTMVNLVSNTTVMSFQLMELGCERVMRSTSNYLVPEFQLAIDIVASGKVGMKRTITHRFPMEEVNQAFDVMLNKQEHKAFKVMIVP